MEIRELVKEMEKQISGLKPETARLERTIEDFTKELKEKTNALAALEMALEALKMGGYSACEEVKVDSTKTLNIIETTEDGIRVVKTNVKQPTMKHLTARIAQYDKNGNIIKSWLTQKAAAKEMSCSQANVSYFMKKTKESQLKKKGYYLAWDY